MLVKPRRVKRRKNSCGHTRIRCALVTRARLDGPAERETHDRAQQYRRDVRVADNARTPAQAPDDLAVQEQRVFACVSRDEPRYIDTITQDSGMEVMTVSSALLQLELRHLVRQLPGKQFLRT